MKRLLVCTAALILAAQPARATIAQAAPAEQSTHQRLLPLEGVPNARDIGGYRTTDGRMVKWDVIYRTGELSHLTAQDKAVLEARDLRSIHDLRTVEERRTQPTIWTGADAPTITAFDYSMDMSGFAALFQGDITAGRARDVFAATYPEMLKMQRPQQRALFADLLKGEGAILYHCSAGKDRTGMATALILSALGVPRETILADYELSNQYYRPDLAGAALSDNPQAAAFMRLPEDVRAIFMGVDARYLQAVFDIIDRDYGSVEAYLDKELGVGPEDIQRLRSLYTV